MKPFPLSISGELEAIQAAQRWRRRRVVEEWISDAGGTRAVVEGAERIVFCSNDYLGFARHPRAIEAFTAAARRDGVGSGASHLVTGHSREHHALEEALAAFTGRQRALLFSTGYMANLGAVCALLSRGDLVLEDRLNHASLLDAGLLARARLARYPHADVAAAARKLRASARRALILTDGVFSMDGDVAPLAELAAVAQSHGAALMVDDAHGLGVLGARGRGTVEAAGLDAHQVPLLMGTLGKALGSFGAFVAGDAEWIELLVQRARTYIYTTALPPAAAAATRVALALCDEEPWRRERVLRHVERFRRAMREIGAPLAPSQTPIQPLMLGRSEQALALSEALWARGFWVAAIRPPTVPEGSARLRITFSAEHTDGQVEQLITTLGELSSHLHGP